MRIQILTDDNLVISPSIGLGVTESEKKRAKANRKKSLVGEFGRCWFEIFL